LIKGYDDINAHLDD